MSHLSAKLAVMDLLEISSGAGVTRVPARGERIRIGRAADNDVVLSDQRSVSRYHAELVWATDGWEVRDCGSRNGTYLDGNRVRGGQTFAPGHVVSVGDVTLRLIVPDDPGLTVEGSDAQDLHLLATLLSAREREVLALVASGRTDDQAARELYISVKTVRTHLDRIREKSGVRRRAELTRLALRLGLTSGEQ